MFIQELTLRSWFHAEEDKRRTVKRKDFAAAITHTDLYDFLAVGLSLTACPPLPSIPPPPRTPDPSPAPYPNSNSKPLPCPPPPPLPPTHTTPT